MEKWPATGPGQQRRGYLTVGEVKNWSIGEVERRRIHWSSRMTCLLIHRSFKSQKSSIFTLLASFEGPFWCFSPSDGVDRIVSQFVGDRWSGSMFEEDPSTVVQWFDRCSAVVRACRSSAWNVCRSLLGMSPSIVRFSLWSTGQWRQRFLLEDDSIHSSSDGHEAEEVSDELRDVQHTLVSDNVHRRSLPNENIDARHLDRHIDPKEEDPSEGTHTHRDLFWLRRRWDSSNYRGKQGMLRIWSNEICVQRNKKICTAILTMSWLNFGRFVIDIAIQWRRTMCHLLIRRRGFVRLFHFRLRFTFVFLRRRARGLRTKIFGILIMMISVVFLHFPRWIVRTFLHRQRQSRLLIRSEGLNRFRKRFSRAQRSGQTRAIDDNVRAHFVVVILLIDHQWTKAGQRTGLTIGKRNDRRRSLTVRRLSTRRW